MDNEIAIDIIVPTFNRPYDIEKFINEIQKQDYPNFKVYIIDDHGDYRIDHLIPNNDGRFYFERIGKNKGQTYVRNFGLKMGNAPIVIFMDDDAWFLDENALMNISQYFNLKSDIGALMFDIKEPDRKWLSERFEIEDQKEIGEFIACGVAFKRDAIESIGGFSEFLHSYGEETDISMQLIESNYRLYFGKKIRVYHNYIPGNRDEVWSKRFKHNTVRNDLLVVLLRYPLIMVLPYFILKSFSHLNHSIQKQNENLLFAIKQIILAAFSAIKMSNKAIKNRAPLSLKNFFYWKKVRF